MAHGEPILFSLYIYAPNKIAPIIFTVLYAVSGGFYIWQCVRYGALKLTGLHLLSAFLFAVGYALREYGAYNYLYDPDDETPLALFIVSQIFIYICPPLLELANYHTLGRLFYYVPSHSPIPASKVLRTFGGLMLLVELLNALGASLAVNASASAAQQTTGGDLIIAAISLQLVVILIFICLAGTFHRCCAKADLGSSPVRTLLLVLYSSMTLIFLRCIYRLVEHVGPTEKDISDIEALRRLNPLFRYEAFFYVFEATLMLINSALWNVWNPGRLLPKDYNVYLSADGTERVGEKVVDARPGWAKFAHVLTFGVFFRRAKVYHEVNELSERQSPE